jgi:hypothetical protein
MLWMTFNKMIDEDVLRDKVREAIQAGALPNRRPDRTWGGPGVGACCRICSTPVKQDEVELEIEFGRGWKQPLPERYHVHVSCFAAWESERQNPEFRTLVPADTEPRRVLPEAVDTGNIIGRERYTTFKRGPA